jgi:hypothetical protein
VCGGLRVLWRPSDSINPLGKFRSFVSLVFLTIGDYASSAEEVPNVSVNNPTPQQAWEVRSPTVPMKVGWLQPDACINSSICTVSAMRRKAVRSETACVGNHPTARQRRNLGRVYAADEKAARKAAAKEFQLNKFDERRLLVRPA